MDMIPFNKEGETPLDDISGLIPILNGNGRWARLVTDIWLASQGCETLEWGKDNLVDIE